MAGLRRCILVCLGMWVHCLGRLVKAELNFFPARPIIIYPARNVGILIAFTFLAFSFSLTAQPAEGAPLMRLERLSLRDGLSQTFITDVFQDRNGIMWFGTQDGLNAYDGQQFEVFRSQPLDTASLSDNYITAIREDDRGYIWVGTRKGLNRLNRKTMACEAYFSWFNESRSLSNNAVTALLHDDAGNLWVGTENGLNRYNWVSNDFDVFYLVPGDSTSLTNNRINNLYQAPDGRVFICTEGGVSIFTPGYAGFDRIRKAFRVSTDLSSNRVKAVALQNDSTLWLATDLGIDRYNIAADRYTFFSPFGKREQTPVTSLLLDSDGELWAGTLRGLCRFDTYRQGFTLVNRLEESALFKGYNGVSDLLQDQTGLIWVGSMGAGAFTLDKGRQYIRHFSQFNRRTDGSVNDNALCMADFGNDRVAIGTTDGLVFFNPSKEEFTVPTSRKNALSAVKSGITALLPQGDSVLWLGTSGNGVYRYHAKENTLEAYGVPQDNAEGISRWVNDLSIAPNGRVYIATSGAGLFVLNPVTGALTNYRYEPGNPYSIKDNTLNAVEVDRRGRVWLATANNGLYSLNEAKGELKQFTLDPKQNASLGSNSLLHLYLEGDNLWIGTRGGGLNLMDLRSETFKVFNRSSGLADDVVYAICQDGRNNLWVSTNKGLSLLERNELAFRNYSEIDGLVSNNYNRGVTALSGGYVLFGGITGLDMLRYAEMEINRNVPPVRITAVSILQPDSRGQLTPVSRNFRYYWPDTVYLEPSNPGITFEFASLDFRQPAKNLYAYRLEGFLNAWTYIGNRNIASFTSLEPGVYRFMAKGSNNDGVWNDSGVDLVVVVRPHIYQTLWFKLCVIGLVALLLYGLYRLRVASIQRQKRELKSLVEIRTKEIARERDTNATLLKEIHHRVKNNLQIITSLLSLQSRYVDDRKVIDLFEECQNRIHSMSLIHEKMYKTKDLSTVSIEEYITDLVNSLVRTYRLHDSVKLQLQINVNQFNSDTLTPLGLIINEVISNALKYAFPIGESGTIHVQLDRFAQTRYRMVIGDDGVGLGDDENGLAESDSFGTELIQALTEQLNGTITHMRERPGTVYEVIFEEVA